MALGAILSDSAAISEGNGLAQNIALLRQFLAVAKSGSISRGARNLAMTQPAVTKSIHRLEDELGVTLFERRARGVALTRFGESLLRHAKLIEAEWSFAQAEIRAFRKGFAGQLRIGGGPFFGVALLPRAIAELQTRFPALRIDLQIGVNEITLPKLLDGDLDIVIGRLPKRDALPEHIVQRRIAEVRICAIAARAHPLAGRRSLTGAQLSGFPWVVYQQDPETIANLLSALRRIGANPPQIAIESTSLVALFEMLRSGPYLSCLAEGLLDTHIGAGIVALDIGGEVSSFSAGAIYPRAVAEIAPVKHLLRLLSSGATASRSA